MVVAAVVVAVVLAVTTLLTWVVAVLVGTDASLVVLGRGAANVWPLSMFFGGLAALAAGFLHRSAPVTAIATGTLVGMYVIDLVGKLADEVEPLRYVSAFRYYGSAIQDGIDPVAFGAVTLAGIALAIAGAEVFRRRDVLA
jgi:ABC-2 type transport system permease protein